MADVFTVRERSWVMSRVRSKDTTPERAVRSLLHRMGFRFRLHGNDLPGKPDIVLPRHHCVVLVHGCFWHRHQRCSRATIPASNAAYWKMKFRRNVERDRQQKRDLQKCGWRVLVVWECELRCPDKLVSRMFREIGAKSSKPLRY